MWYCDKISGESNFNIEIFLSSSTLLILCLRWGEHYGSINMWHRLLTSQQTRSGQNSKEERPGQATANKAEVNFPAFSNSQQVSHLSIVFSHVELHQWISAFLKENFQWSNHFLKAYQLYSKHAGHEPGWDTFCNNVITSSKYGEMSTLYTVGRWD